MKLRIIYDTWFVPPKHRAWVVYPFMFFRDPDAEVSDELFRHELEHVYQVHRVGWLGFYCKYIWYSLTRGYRYNPYEIEAREAAKNGLGDFDYACLMRWLK